MPSTSVKMKNMVGFNESNGQHKHEEAKISHLLTKSIAFLMFSHQVVIQAEETKDQFQSPIPCVVDQVEEVSLWLSAHTHTLVGGLYCC